MANTYSWTFPTLQTYANQDGFENVIYVVHWYLNGVCPPESGSYNVQLFGAQEIAPFVSGSRPFIPYEQITEAEITEWLEEAMGPEKLSELRGRIDQQLHDLINPPVLYLPPPWLTPTPTPSPTENYIPEPTPEITPEPTPTPSSI